MLKIKIFRIVFKKHKFWFIFQIQFLNKLYTVHETKFHTLGD